MKKVHIFIGLFLAALIYSVFSSYVFFGGKSMVEGYDVDETNKYVNEQIQKGHKYEGETKFEIDDKYTCLIDGEPIKENICKKKVMGENIIEECEMKFKTNFLCNYGTSTMKSTVYCKPGAGFKVDKNTNTKTKTFSC